MGYKKYRRNSHKKRIFWTTFVIAIIAVGAFWFLSDKEDSQISTVPNGDGSVASKALSEVKIDRIDLLGPQGMEPWVQIVVKYNENTVPNDIYHIKLDVKLSDGRSIVIGTLDAVWKDIPGEDPLNFGKVLEYRSTAFSSIVTEQKTKPISERGKLDFVVIVDKTTPVTSPRYVPKQDEVAFGWRDPGSYLGYEAWLRLTNVSRSGVYIATFTGAYIVGGTGVETVSKYMCVGESYEFRITHRGKKVSDVKYSIDYKEK